MEIALQGDSRGIKYEGYDKDFRQCIFEESDVLGKNERYEFRCTPDLECCGRICCVPVPAVVPLWLIILFLILGLILLAAVLGTLAWLWAKRKPKKAVTANGGYRAIQQTEHSSSVGDDELARARARQRELEEMERERERQLMLAQRGNALRRSSHSSASSQPPPPPPASHEPFVPSPMTVEHITAPKPSKLQKHEEDEISRASQAQTSEPAPLNPQRAQIAYYRPFVPDPMEESSMPHPERVSISRHDLSEILPPAFRATVSTLERPETKQADVMYYRPGFDNVPSY